RCLGQRSGVHHSDELILVGGHDPDHAIDGPADPAARSPEHGFVLRHTGQTNSMVILGVVLLLLGFFLHIQVLWIIGIILVVVGAILLLLPVERVGGRRWY